MNPALAAGHAGLMDRVYRHQRHFYDLTRKYYLLGRDGMIVGLAISPGASVLELGCGTGRNLAAVAARWPQARLFGLDISEEMLATAKRAIKRAGLADRVRFARGDASRFDPEALFGEAGFDRVIYSYTLSMVPEWQLALRAAYGALKTEGELHIIDFGTQERLPRWFRALLRRWLAKFHVEPRDGLRGELEVIAAGRGGTLVFRSLYGGYAIQAILRK